MITEQFIDAYMDGVDGGAWRALGPASNEQFRGWVRNGLTAVYPLMVAAEREACAQVAEHFSGMKWAAYDMATGVFPKQSRMEQAIAAAIRARNTSSEAGQALGCASEGGPVSSSDNPST